ncbi:TIGR01777 family oxidoreductase [Nonomuraea sp. NPDC059194]|uniref:TIGR01777 family oxidoreductase n=1 Tax=Nonomuraea sp. NPDC059194 TaxID=3346764 RepID=UPI00368BE578
MAIIVTGASGLLGRALVGALTEEGERVVRLVRRPPTSSDEALWQPDKGLVDQAALDGAQAVVHLAGAGLGERRWSEAYRREIVDSRVAGTRTLVTALKKLERPPHVLLSASGAGFYGDTGDRATDESGPRGEGFLAELCEQWEAEAAQAESAGIRTVRLRTAITLSSRGGALKQMLPIFKLGLGAPLGSGGQWWAWISLDDWVRAVLHILRNRDIAGPVNVAAPEPVTNKEFTKALGRALKKPTMPIAVPGFALRTGLGGFADEGLLIGQRAVPAKLLDSGFRFLHPTLDEALAAVL